MPLKFSFLTISKLGKSFVLYPRNTIPFDVSFLSIIASPELLKIIFSEINFKTKQGEECLVYHAEKLFDIIAEKYEKYDIDEKPFIIIKADSGTYGMGVISIDNIDQIKNLNRKQRNKMLDYTFLIIKW